MARSRRFNEAFERLAAREEADSGREFVTPVRAGRPVEVVVDGVVCRYRFTPPRFSGWAVCRPLAPDLLGMSREADANERRAWLSARPAARLVLCRTEGADWLAAPERAADTPLVPVRLVAGCQQFDVVLARREGSQWWWESAEAGGAVAEYLRAALVDGRAPFSLTHPGVTPVLLNAYALALR
jgi:hypothetical protein